MYWRVAICQSGIRAQICMGKDPTKIANEQKKIQKNLLCNRYRIELLFTKCDDSNIDNLVSDSWMRYFRADEDFLYGKELDKIASKYGAQGTTYALNGYNYAVSTEKPNVIEILVNLKNITTYEQFIKKYNGIEGAIDLLYQTDKVYTGTSDPGTLVFKWIKRLQLELEQ